MRVLVQYTHSLNDRIMDNFLWLLSNILFLLFSAEVSQEGTPCIFLVESILIFFFIIFEASMPKMSIESNKVSLMIQFYHKNCLKRNWVGSGIKTTRKINELNE